MWLRLRGLAWHMRVRWDHSLRKMWAVLESEWFALQRIALLLLTMPLSWALRTVFGTNVPPPHTQPPCQSRFDWHSVFFFFSIKNVLFLVHCVKTWLSHPVYVCAHWNNFPSPEGLSGLFSYMCCSPVCRASHCMQTITQPCASAVGPLGQDGSQLPITLPPFFHFFPVFTFSPVPAWPALRSFLSSYFQR